MRIFLTLTIRYVLSLILFKIIDARINIRLIKISVTRCLIFWIGSNGIPIL